MHAWEQLSIPGIWNCSVLWRASVLSRQKDLDSLNLGKKGITWTQNHNLSPQKMTFAKYGQYSECLTHNEDLRINQLAVQLTCCEGKNLHAGRRVSHHVSVTNVAKTSIGECCWRISIEFICRKMNWWMDVVRRVAASPLPLSSRDSTLERSSLNTMNMGN